MVLQENPVERICQRFQCLFSDVGLQFTFPNGNRVPTHGSQLLLHLSVSLPVASDLTDPELTVRLRNLAAFRTLNANSTSIV